MIQQFTRKLLLPALPLTMAPWSLLAQSGSTTDGSTGLAPLSLMLALLFSFLGGLILNLMPCVLPVLSIKIMHLIKKSGQERRVILKNGFSYTAGVVLSFLTLAAALLLLRSGGEEIGWGFQLQSPYFVAFLGAFMFIFALNLFGIFEIGTSLMRVGENRKEQDGLSGAFISGVLATIVATPCTGPFMASALGFAMTQPPAVSLLIFAFLGLGMASPFLIISFFPALLRFVPRPGPWMEGFKQLMGFPLLATVIWLVWLLGRITGVDVMGAALGALLLIGIGAWIVGRKTLPHLSGRTRAAAWSSALLLLLTAALLTREAIATHKPDLRDLNARIERTTDGWYHYTPDILTQLRRTGEPIFIDFTADWCVSCKVNKRVALSNENVIKKFEELGVLRVRADWTHQDKHISRLLQSYGRNSVPFYLLYYGDSSRKPLILPEILTPQIVIDALATLTPIKSPGSAPL